MEYAEYRAHDAVGLAALVAGGEVSAAELLEVAVARAEAVDGKLNAIVRPMYDLARDRTRTPLTGPFAGVPFLIKDLSQDYAGLPTGSGSRSLAHLSAERHSAVVERWLEAGLVIFGKTNTPEFGAKGITEPEVNGPTRNPWDLSRTPGGSSGGSAAAVAAGVVPMAGANDGGGSIRIPAACCGLFGLKPGRGLVPAGPATAEDLHGAATNGAVSRTVRDSAALLDVLTARPDPGGPYLAARPELPYAELARRPRPLRIGFTTRSPIGTEVDPHAVAAVDETVGLLARLGHQVEPAEPDIDHWQLALDFLAMWTTQLAQTVDEIRRTTGAGPGDFELDTHLLAAAGRSLPAPRYFAAHQRWNTYSRQLAAFHDRYDLLLTPTLARPPVRIGELDTPAPVRTLARGLMKAGLLGTLAGTKAWERAVIANLAATPYTQLANITGRPATSVPTYRTPEGLPLGTQFVGPLGGEGTLLALAAQIEAEQPWAHREPAL
ncbi:amidase [Streptomyces sp. CHA1]|uniref:amidase n=1 Tax=Streptomyces TaxID=1883 RepID=UPI001BFC8846|nr:MULTISPECIES: amidase family protein [unclassified Streptomyces]MBT3158396.1 amidase [Streptomyces sp. G11C]MCO6704067.1 amidase [Streptomyces sp. CHB9.2]MCO6710359.1 amidase [Streptomyces sp. CHA3]MCO6716134.1 amidase [Streptomyces sp. CHB19.2]MCO6722265.1 amidase [Streptomyces sp. Vc714c-19]